MSLQGDRILKERGKFEIPLSLSGFLWYLSFNDERKVLVPGHETPHPRARRRIKSPRKKTKEKNTHFPLNLHLMFCALLTQSNPVTGDKTNPVFARSTAKTGNITIK